MTNDPTGKFRPAYLKIDRAEHHINDLNRRIADFFEKEPFHLATFGEPKAARETHFIKQNAAIPSEFSLIIGDAIHNLRSALDIAIFTMIGHLATRPEAVQFPFARREESLVSTMTSRQIELAGENVVAEIQRLKPYMGGNETLEAVHTLDIADKHKLIITTASTGLMNGADFSEMLPVLRRRPNVSVRIPSDTSFRVAPPEGTPRKIRKALSRQIRAGEYKRDAQPAFEICFGPDLPKAGEPVVPALRGMAVYVRSALDSIIAAHERD